MPSTMHIDVDPGLKAWLERKSKLMKLSKNSIVKLYLHAAWQRDEAVNLRLIRRPRSA